MPTSAAAIAVLVALVVALTGHGGGSTTVEPASARPPALSGLSGDRSTVDGIPCAPTEQVLFHVHAHLALFVNGRAAGIPAGVGIPGAQVAQTSRGPVVVSGTCFYWLHAHTADGLIHIESPVNRVFTLGDWFDIWHQPLGSSQVATATGPVTAFVDGRPFPGDPRTIPLASHTRVQLDVGTPAPGPQPFTFPSGR